MALLRRAGVVAPESINMALLAEADGRRCVYNMASDGGGCCVSRVITCPPGEGDARRLRLYMPPDGGEALLTEGEDS